MLNARERKPEGKTNLVSSRSGDGFSDTQRERLNNPVYVLKPDDVQVPDPDYVNFPIFPKSRYATLYHDGEKNTSTTGYKATTNFELTEKELTSRSKRTKVARDFISKHKSIMWKLNPAYYKKTPDEICDMIVDDPSFVKTVTGLRAAVTTYRIKCSDGFTNSVYREHITPDYHSYKRNISTYDPFMNSLTTSREKRVSKMESLLRQSIDSEKRSFGKGVAHTVEIGNFSRYTAFLQLNKETALKR